MLYTVYDVEKITGISAYTIRKKIRDGILPTTKAGREELSGFGGGYRISIDDLKVFASRDPKYKYILNLIAKDKKEEKKDPDKMDLLIRIKELELKLLRYEKLYGPLE